MQAMVQIKEVSKNYGAVQAVNALSLQIEQGEVFGILGPNGAGKTTLLEMMEGLLRPASGSVTVGGYDVVRDADEVKKIIGVQPQAPFFFDKLSLAELLGMFGALYGHRVDAGRLLDKVGLLEKAGRRIGHLSGGERQRFSIAVALVNEPRLIFLDEPTAGLDPQARQDLWQLIRDLRDEGKTVVLTTHYMDEAEVLCDRVAILEQGRVIALDTPAALIGELLAGGFQKPYLQQQANLEDVYLQISGKKMLVQ